MLSQSSVAIGTNLAEIAATNGIKLVPKQSTLIQELSAAIGNNMFSKIEKREYIEPSLLHAAAGNDVMVNKMKTYTQSSHDLLMDNYQVDLSNIIANHIAFARGVVNKEINLLKEKIQQGLSDYKFKEAEDFFNISYFKPADVFASYIMENEIGTYKGSTTKFFFDPVDLSKLVKEEFDLGGYILTGDAEQDNYISTWFNAEGKDRMLGYLTENVPEYSLSVHNLMDYSLINYLFYRNLLNKADLELGYSTVQLKSKCVANRDYFGNKLCVAMDAYRRDMANGRVLTTDSETAFSYFNDKPLSITVYEENFAKLAEAGCSIEVLFGYVSSENSNSVTVNELIANKENYISKWNTVRSLYVISMNGNKINIFRQIACSKFDETIVELTEEEKEVSNNSSQLLQETRDKAYAFIDNIQLSEIDDIDRICLELVAGIRFRFSNAYFILNEMTEIFKMSDNIDPMEAALYASVKYVTDFLFEQCEIVRV